jgi:hypothetical protein
MYLYEEGDERNIEGLTHQHPGGGPYTFIPTVQPTPGAENNAFSQNQTKTLLAFWGNGTLCKQPVDPLGSVIQFNQTYVIQGLGGLVTGTMVHIPLDNLDGDDTGYY